MITRQKLANVLRSVHPSVWYCGFVFAVTCGWAVQSTPAKDHQTYVVFVALFAPFCMHLIYRISKQLAHDPKLSWVAILYVIMILLFAQLHQFIFLTIPSVQYHISAPMSDEDEANEQKMQEDADLEALNSWLSRHPDMFNTAFEHRGEPVLIDTAQNQFWLVAVHHNYVHIETLWDFVDGHPERTTDFIFKNVELPESEEGFGRALSQAVEFYATDKNRLREIDARARAVKTPSLLTSDDSGYLTFLYFSTIVSTTTGFGEIYPVGIPARILVMIQSTSSVLLLAVTVSVISQRYSEASASTSEVGNP